MGPLQGVRNSAHSRRTSCHWDGILVRLTATVGALQTWGTEAIAAPGTVQAHCNSNPESADLLPAQLPRCARADQRRTLLAILERRIKTVTLHRRIRLQGDNWASPCIVMPGFTAEGQTGRLCGSATFCAAGTPLLSRLGGPPY